MSEHTPEDNPEDRPDSPTSPPTPIDPIEVIGTERKAAEAQRNALVAEIATAPISSVPQPSEQGPSSPSAPHSLSSQSSSQPLSQQSSADRLERVLFEVKRVIVGQDRAIERILVAVLAGGHCLLESVPGLAKTLMVESLARSVGGDFNRIQFTPDLLPADIVGTRIYRNSTESFDVELGPIFANFLLADEINRAPAKVQSALLEIMAEKQVTIGGTTYPAPNPFIVLATQNPIESEGVYPLPEAQRDRFLMKISIDYPSAMEELEIVNRMGVDAPEANTVLSVEDLQELQAQAAQGYCDRSVVEYAVNLVLSTRHPENYGLADLAQYLEIGASPRASLGLVRAGRAMAMLRGRTYVVPQDIFDVAPEVLRHRLMLSYEALANDITTDHVLQRILSTVPAPVVQPSQVSGPTDAFYGSATDARSWSA